FLFSFFILFSFFYFVFFFFFNDTATTEIYTTRHTLSLHDALPIPSRSTSMRSIALEGIALRSTPLEPARSEEHTSELQSRLVISYAVFCLKKKKTTNGTKSMRPCCSKKKKR